MKITKQVKKPVSISSLMLAGMAHYDEHRGVNVLHASDLTKDTEFCPREYALLGIEGKTKKGMVVSASMRHTFDMGNDIAARVCNEYLDGLAVGHWKCESCGKQRIFQKRPKNGCDEPQYKCRWTYEEVKVVFSDFVSGSLDLIVDVGKPKLRMVELKTMAIQEFEKLKAPLAEHRLRTNLYLHLLRKSGYSDEIEVDTGTVLYVAKSYGKFDKEKGTYSPFKEYEVQYNKDELKPYLQKMEEFVEWRQYQILPKAICPTNVCKRAKSCSVSKQCFSGEYKAGDHVEAVEVIG